MRKIYWPLAATVVLVAGCNLAPKYEQPVSPVGTTWTAPATATNGVTAAKVTWPEFFKDARLKKLIELALANNRDLRVAALNVEIARAQYRIQGADQFPTLDAAASASRQRTPASLTGIGKPITASQYSVTGIASYEVDLFGRVHSLKEQALESYLATTEASLSARISLVSEVAVQYFAQQAAAEQLKISQETLDTVTKSLELTKRRFELGDTSELDVSSAQVLVQTARASVANYQQQLAQADNALALLVGAVLPADLPAKQVLDDKAVLDNLSPGMPADLLQLRPDILAAEHQLKAANANIGAARAAFFPRILLTGGGGTASAQLTDLFTGPSATWNFSPQITVPIFEGGRNRANLDVAKLSKLVEVAQYERAIQSAFREVSDALVVRSWIDEQLSAVQTLVAAQQKRLTLAEARYKSGVDSFLAVLTAQQDLFTAQQTLTNVRFARLANHVTLYRVLGGGWSEATAK